MTVGIYKIENIKNNKPYIGSSNNIERRWSEHIRQLNKGEHHSIKLQRAWNKYGQNNFEFEILEECKIEELLNKEHDYIYKVYNSIDSGYNNSDPLKFYDTPKNRKRAEIFKAYNKWLGIYNSNNDIIKYSTNLLTKLINKEYLRVEEYYNNIKLIEYALLNYSDNISIEIISNTDKKYRPTLIIKDNNIETRYIIKNNEIKISSIIDKDRNIYTIKEYKDI